MTSRVRRLLTVGMRFNHIGIPTTERFEGEIELPQLKVTVSDHQGNSFGTDLPQQRDVGWLCGQQHAGRPVRDHETGAPVELLQIDRNIRSDL